MTRPVVFLGPTLSVDEARHVLDADYRPPVAQGDVYRATVTGASVLCIIDGYFERVPTVWHKEILWALSEGIVVWGAASMGALRAAELHRFGMVGIGWVFRAFADGELESDDEVAVAHTPLDEAGGCRPLSVAMVDLRRTVQKAADAGVLTADTAEALLSATKALHFSERDYLSMIQSGRRAGFPGAELEAFANWFPAGQIRQKRDDALEALRQLASGDVTSPCLPEGFVFESTDAWRAARASIDRSYLWPFLDLKRDDSCAFCPVSESLRTLLSTEADRLEVQVDWEAVAADIVAFRISQGLQDAALFRRWLRDRDLTESGLLEAAAERRRLIAAATHIGDSDPVR